MNKTYKGRSRKWFLVSPKGWARRVDLNQFRKASAGSKKQ